MAKRNPFGLFGFEIKRSKKKEKEEQKLKSFVTPVNDDGAVTVQEGGVFGSYVDLDGTTRNEFELITRYRDMSIYAEIDSAIDDVVNETIVMDENEPIVTIDVTKIKASAKVQKKIEDEFENILKLLDFQNQGYSIFRNWYIDGRLYYHAIIDKTNPKAGIKDVRYIDPRQIRKMRITQAETDQDTGAELVRVLEEFYVYNPRGIQNAHADVPHSSPVEGVQGIRIAKDSVVYVHSGILDKWSSAILSHLHKAIKPYNQLKMMEDAVVIYRIARAPERRLFYVDVGKLPKHKAEDHLRMQMQKFRTKMVYDVNTGEMRSDKRHLSMLEDYWIPRREGSNATEIDTLPGGSNLGEIGDLEYFQTKLYQSLNIPTSRLEASEGFVLGRATEINRDEIKFTKFIHRLRLRFSHLFNELLRKQLILKNIVTEDDWNVFQDRIYYDFANDNHFSELKNLEILKNRLEVLDSIDPYINRFFDESWVKEKILRQSEIEIEEIEKGMEQDQKDHGSDDEEMVQVPLAPDTRIVQIPKSDLPNFVPGASKEEEEIKQIQQDTKKVGIETDKLEKGEEVAPGAPKGEEGDSGDKEEDSKKPNVNNVGE
jgi:hypothetical protein